jgi:ABC-type multidrug transport system ATPase subunit
MDVRTQMPLIRSNLSVCPQHTVAWDELTVEEHLQLYAGLKGVALSEIDNAVKQSVSDVTLQEKMYNKCSELSGGQQRRLNLAMALIGDSKVIYLDEPTSGVDPANRRALWNLLRAKRPGRVIILSTHFSQCT